MCTRAGYRRVCQAVGLVRGPHGAREPERTTQAIGTRRGARLLEPLRVDLKGFVRIHKDVAVAVFRSSTLHTHLLMPAVHATHRIWMHREGEVLVHASVFPPYPVGIRVDVVAGLNTLHLPSTPLLWAHLL